MSEEIVQPNPIVSGQAPDFAAEAVMEDNRIESFFSLSSMRGRYVLLLFYPLDFSYVCPSEILAFEQKLDEFKARNALVVGISVDSVYAHLAWRKTPVEKGGIGPIRFPLVSDLKKRIARSYGVLSEHGSALRALFIVNREGKVRHAVVNDAPIGRSVTEALRTLDAIRMYEERGNLCPANWQKGDEGIRPTSSGLIDYLSKFSRK